MLLRGAETLVGTAQERAARIPDRVCVRYLLTGDATGPSVELTYGELERRARAIAAALQDQAPAGDRALLLFPSGLEFVAAYFGCLFAGVIPVPVYPPDLVKPERSLAKLHGIVADCGPTLALTTAEYLPLLSRIAPPGVRCLASDAVELARADAWRAPAITGDTVALLQYTSGSTGAPKGAVIRHHQLLANERSIAHAMGDVGTVVGWLPVFHDMGLIGNVLQVVHAGTTLVLMSPFAFLKRPLRWLEAITTFRGTVSGGPNFAYDLCVRRASEADLARLDLASWRLAFCGAEPVREATFHRFSTTFAPHGFAPRAFFPCYGLAEATLFVTGKPREDDPTITAFSASALDRSEVDPADGDDRRVLVSAGVPAPTEDVRIVDPDRRVVTDRVGEIWVRGPGIASGYWGRDDPDTFGAELADGTGPFLRTGDLGFFHGGELYIAGRAKDMIILAGRNLFPPDLEATAEAATPSVRKGCCAAFSVDDGGEERLVIMAEHDGDDATEVIRTIKRAVAEQHQAAVHDVVLVARGTLPKTSSGKLERHACRKIYPRKSW